MSNVTTITINGADLGKLAELARVLGGDEAAVGRVKERVKRFEAVIRGPEMDRVLGLRRRPIPDPTTPYACQLAAWMTRRLARCERPYPLWVDGKKKGDHLFPTQAFALRELVDEGALAGPIRAGGGKMLLAYLIFAVLKAKRPLYMLPKSMEKDTIKEVRKYSADWHGPAASRISYLSYQRLSSPSSAERTLNGKVIKVGRLEQLQPDVIVLDEAHMVARGGKCYLRLLAYQAAHPEVVIIPISGSFLRTSLNDAAHLLHWALNAMCPVPNDWDERQQWAGALDEKSSWGARTEFGDLLQLLNEQEQKQFAATSDPDEQRAVVCSAVGRWILETPGVIGSQDGPLGIPLTMEPRFVEPSRQDPAIESAMRVLLEGDRVAKRPKWSLPNGEKLIDQFAVSRVRHSLQLGFWQEQFSYEGVRSCLASRSVEQSLAKKIVKELASATELDIELRKAVGTLTSGAQEAGPTSLQRTGSHLSPINSCSTRKEESASSARLQADGVTINGTVPTTHLYSWITAMRPGAYEDSCARSAISRSEAWEILLKGSPELLRTLKAGFEAGYPPQEYRDARKKWAEAARNRLKHNHRNIDSEVHLKEAIAEGDFKDLRKVLDEWNAQQRLYTELTGKKEPPSVARWISNEVFDEVAQWLSQHGTGLVWVSYIDLGRKLSEHLGIAYFGAKKLDASGRHITDMKKGEPAIVSIDACGTGTNLQHFHHKNLWLSSPREQPLARTHRPGQDAERVENYLYLPGRSQLERYWKQYDYAKNFATPMTRQAQRLVYAISSIPTVEGACGDLDRYRSYRWKAVSKKLDGED